jgi:hypothetical protein
LALFRKNIKDNVVNSSLQQLKIKRTLQKKKQIEGVMNILLMMKKVQDLKKLSLNSE